SIPKDEDRRAGGTERRAFRNEQSEVMEEIFIGFAFGFVSRVATMEDGPVPRHTLRVKAGGRIHLSQRFAVKATTIGIADKTLQFLFSATFIAASPPNE